MWSLVSGRSGVLGEHRGRSQDGSFGSRSEAGKLLCEPWYVGSKLDAVLRR